MEYLILGLVLLGVAPFVYLSWAIARKPRAVQAVTCPKCSTANAAAEHKCGNCDHVGIQSEVILTPGVKNVYWKCPACETAVNQIPCKHCGANLANLFRT
jgi:DnaJ-class molecular chaperone